MPSFAFLSKVNVRGILALFGGAGLCGALFLGSLGAIAFFFPNLAGANYHHSTVSGKFKVYQNWKPEPRTFTVSSEKGIYALLGKCSKCGSRLRWDEDSWDIKGRAGRFKCCCCGSNFDVEGQVVAGPAPRMLRRCAISLENGSLFINPARTSRNHFHFSDDDFLVRRERFTPDSQTRRLTR